MSPNKGSKTKARPKRRKSYEKRRSEEKRRRRVNYNTTLVFADEEQSFWEVDEILDRRVKKGEIQYRVKWKGYRRAEATWEPTDNFCDSALEEALEFDRKHGLVSSIELNEEILEDLETEHVPSVEDRPDSGTDSSDEMSVISIASDSSQRPQPPLEDGRWRWTDDEQLQFREVERIDVQDTDSRQRVIDCRLNGTPVVLVGHTGWANFAKGWLEPVVKESSELGHHFDVGGIIGLDLQTEEQNEKDVYSEEQNRNDLQTEQLHVNDLHNEDMNGKDAHTKKDDSRDAHSEEPHGNDLHIEDTTGHDSHTKEQDGKEAQSVEQNRQGLHIKDMNGKDSHPKELDVEGVHSEEQNKKDLGMDEENREEARIDEQNGGEYEWLDLSMEHNLNVEKMAADIGNDLVPVVTMDYNEHNPLQATIKLSAFLKTYWPNEDGNCQSDARLYLHQWQFPLSSTAGKMLCHKNKALPNCILGVDLLKFWLDLPQCRMDSAFQYLFMGREGTMSKLHRDKGGLAISIAPILGVKECVLVHRSDGAPCFYHLDASLDNVNLHKYPLMAHARIWRTSIKPGEILLMPQGTYHQCRNLTPCLSYSRFHLDTVNLLPFLQSMVDGDAKEIQHGEVIWNACNGVMDEVDEFVDECRRCAKSTPPRPCPHLTDEMAQNVDTLRSLRNICRETVRRLEDHKRKDRQCDDNLNTIGRCSDWKTIVRDIDDALHHFRHRADMKIRSRGSVSRKPRAKSARAGAERVSSNEEIRDGTESKTTLQHTSTHPHRGIVVLNNGCDTNPTAALSFRMSKEKSAQADDGRVISNDDFCAKVADILQSMEYRSLFRLRKSKPVEGSLQVSDLVMVRLHKTEAIGIIVAIEDQMKAAYLSYDGYPPIYDEYQPYSKIRVSVGGENVEICPADVKEGMKIVNKWGKTGEEYRAIVKRTCCEQFFSVHFHVPPSYHFNRWFPRTGIVSRASWVKGDD